MFARRLIQCGVAGRAKPGEVVSGDLSIIREISGRALLAVVDGLGHGPDAAHAAAVAVTTIHHIWDKRPISRLMEDCHTALMETRGAALAVAVLDANDGTLTWLCVGNVEGRLIKRAAEGRREERALLMQSGIVGHHLPPLHPSTLAVQAGDVIAIATDGVRSDFDAKNSLDVAPQQAAEHILARCGKGTDDALVLIGCWIGRNGEH